MKAKLFTYIYAVVGPRVFAIIFSIRGFVRGTGIRCRFSQHSNSFLVRDSSITRSASTKSRALMYIGGFNQRGQNLFKTYLLDRIEFREDALIVDCGANVGDFHLALWISLPYKFRYMGFEPSPHDFKSLKLNVVEDVNTQIFKLALWNEDKELDFYLDVESASSSLIEPKRSTGITRVTSRRLDSLLKQDVFLLKIEAEGAEPEVLAGTQNVLQRTHYVVVDVGPERGINEESTRDSVVKFLERNNFRILHENRGHRKVVLFVNRNF